VGVYLKVSLKGPNKNHIPIFLIFGSFGCHVITIFDHDSDPENFWYQVREEWKNSYWNPSGLKPETFSTEVQLHSSTPPGPKSYKQGKRTFELSVIAPA
jgi:hypothetical protein